MNEVVVLPRSGDEKSRVPSQKKGDSFLSSEMGEYWKAKAEYRHALAAWQERETFINNRAADFRIDMEDAGFKVDSTQVYKVEKKTKGLFKKKESSKEVLDKEKTKEYRAILNDSERSSLWRIMDKARLRAEHSRERINIIQGLK